ncbi:hypothetical protein NDU88_001396 [Pleurodeles waltl]|uniref:Uncharacterized protein n=1 Tax=Pleurodeles waltl TaxID=8319 RepID=A0AAV7WNG8_PLEWA|nr:hypothetical protein NDU88_001396 [Pleurodeles waltl]
MALKVPSRVYGVSQGRVREAGRGAKGGSFREKEGGSSEGLVKEVISPAGTLDLIWQDSLDFEEEEPGEQFAAQSTWYEEKAGPGTASRMASSGWSGRRRVAVDVPTGRCGCKGVAPTDAAVLGEQRPGPSGIRGGVELCLLVASFVAVAAGIGCTLAVSVALRIRTRVWRKVTGNNEDGP